MHILLKRLAILMLATLCLTGYSQTTQSVFTPTGKLFDFPSLTAVSATTTLDLRQTLNKNFTIEASVTGTPSVCTFIVEGSSNATNWYDLSGPQSCATNFMFHIDEKPVRFLRIEILTLTGTATVLFQYTGV